MQHEIDTVIDQIELGQVWVCKYPETRMLIGSNPIFERKRLVFKGYTLNSDNIIVESGFYDLTNFLKSFTYTNKMIKPGQVYQGLRKSGYVHYLVDSIDGTEVWMRVITNGKPNRTRHRWSCSGLLNNDPIAVSLEEYNEKFIPQSDKNPVTESSSLPSYYEKFEERVTVRNIFEDVLSIFRIRYEQTFDYQINPIIGSVFISAKTEESAKELFYKKIENARNITFQSIERVGYASKQFREEGIL